MKHILAFLVLLAMTSGSACLLATSSCLSGHVLHNAQVGQFVATPTAITGTPIGVYLPRHRFAIYAK